MGIGDFKQPNIVDDSDLPLSSFLSIKDMPDPKESEWQLKNNLFCFKGKLYVSLGVLSQKVMRLNYNNPHASHFRYLCILELIH